MKKIKEIIKYKLVFGWIKDADRIAAKINMCIKALATYSMMCDNPDQLDLIIEIISDLTEFKSQLKEKG